MMETESAHQNGEVKHEMDVQPVELLKTEQDEPLSFQPQQMDLKQEKLESQPQHVRNEFDRIDSVEIEPKLRKKTNVAVSTAELKILEKNSVLSYPPKFAELSC